MYSDYDQLKQYDQHLREKAQEYQDVQHDVAMVSQWVAQRANQLLALLVTCGQLLRSSVLKNNLKSRQL
jgi:hypothetical protein